jgi:hypothetical protein
MFVFAHNTAVQREAVMSGIERMKCQVAAVVHHANADLCGSVAQDPTACSTDSVRHRPAWH